ncbi:SpoIIE family protein phosphatase [Kitasatospora cineracea]|uniref:Serine phosphatase RsbU (Regulator of sigma subunit) n=1 Tax=Kitasatospora cineracea TaxID=88074 RepID=A0A8G1ULM5_9ACTN|nr:SpoIIE family protein phosphatase [Kitasatospora cineracea]ROR46123.1 serine phosphatase RsbU (regulator of sigma subunit) [Kitasatospora cineracea]
MDGEQSGLEATVDRLRTELEGLRTAMRTRAVIEQAKGVLVGRLGCTPEEAFEQLVSRSQTENRKLAQLAADLLANAAPPPAARDVPADPPAEPSPAAAVQDAPVRDAPVQGAPVQDAPMQDAPVPGAPAQDAPARAESASEGENEGERKDTGAGESGEGLATRFHLAAAALTTAADPDELAERLYRAALAPLGAGALVLAVREPDGALRLVGAYGVASRQLSQWQRIPPRTRVPLTEAVRTDRPVWVADRREFAARYPELAGDDLVPGTTVCALPLHARGRLLGALKIGWPEPHHPAPAVEAHLAALADLAADTLLRLPGVLLTEGPPTGLDPAGAPWFRAVLDGLLDPVLVLGTVRDRDGKVVDLQVEHANAPTVDLAGRDATELRGRRLTELYPGMVASGTFDRLRTAAADGIPYRGEAERYVETVAGSARASAMTVCAIPFQDGLLLTWRAHDERDRRIAQLAQTARLARVGTWEWHPGERRIACSDDVPNLFGAPAGTDRLDPRTALGAIAPADREAVRAAALALLDGRTPVTVDFAVRAADGYRSLRALGEAAVADDGRLLSLSGVVQDVTSWRRAEQALSEIRDRLADQRRRTGDEQRAVRALQQALMRPPAGRPVPGLDSAGRYLPAERAHKVGGDWYELLDLPDGTVLLAVGDVSGHGLPAAVAMSQLRYALRGMAYDDAEPGQLLDRLDRMLCHQRADHIAAVTVARLDPRTGHLAWARAGHLPPVLLHDGTARSLEPPPGLILGVNPRARRSTAELDLAPGDTLLLYTDGLIERRGAAPGTGPGADPGGVTRLLHACTDYRAAPDPSGLVDHLLRRFRAPNPFDDICLLAVRRRP